MSKVPKFQFEDYRPTKVANLQPVQGPALANLAILAGGKNENQISHPAVESPQDSEKPTSLCPRCQGDLFLRTFFGRVFCYQCLYLMNAAIGIDTDGFTEVDLVLEGVVEQAEERSAILEYDGGLERKQADKNARVMHIQPVIRGLVRKGLITIEGSTPGAQIETLPPAKTAKVAKYASKMAPQASLTAPPVICAAVCPWYELNPWTRDPALGAWCHYRMEHLEVGTAACEEFSRGEVPSRQPYKQVTATTPPPPPERTFSCADCSHFEANHGSNPRQGWGWCLKRNKGRFGCATACEVAQTGDGTGPDKLTDREIRYLGEE